MTTGLQCSLMRFALCLCINSLGLRAATKGGCPCFAQKSSSSGSCQPGYGSCGCFLLAIANRKMSLPDLSAQVAVLVL